MSDQPNLEEIFLQACKSGDIEIVHQALLQNVDINYQQGWGLRRAVRYNHPEIWQLLLQHKNININLTNQYGLTALHTACRFNIPVAVFDLLKHPAVQLNMKTELGSSPLMVAAKYSRKESVEMILRDRRVDLDLQDNQGRVVDTVVGVAVENRQDDKVEVLECITREREWRRETEGRRSSMEEENIDVDRLHRVKVFDKIKELVGELQELHNDDRMKLAERQEAESVQFVDKLERDLVAFLEDQKEKQTIFITKLKNDKLEFDQRQQDEVTRMSRKQDEETMSLQDTKSRQFVDQSCNSPKSNCSRSNSRRPSLKTHNEALSCDTLSESGSLWEWTVPDEGYCTGNKELPTMIDSARKELECPICMEVMAPPSRIWQCKAGHVICEQCKERMRRESTSGTGGGTPGVGGGPPGTPGVGTPGACPTCKTAPLIGRNRALERISHSLFSLK